jgi:hypothetical protein
MKTDGRLEELLQAFLTLAADGDESSDLRSGCFIPEQSTPDNNDLFIAC